ncbi:hypothetical protein Tsubulata_006501, partial [Turnera subulata]
WTGLMTFNFEQYIALEIKRGILKLRERDDCDFRLCESCFESSFPPQVPHHPLHPAHPLVLLSGGYTGGSLRKGYICDGCDCYSVGFAYRCEEEGCDFKLDVQCALLMNNQTIESSSKPGAGRRTKEHYMHPDQDHHLTLFNCKLPHLTCKLCGGQIIGAAYGCSECRAFLHEACAELGQEIRHPYHLNHPLRTFTAERPDGRCGACHASFDVAAFLFPIYQCLVCRCRFHSSCAAKSLFTAPMKHERHEHRIHYINEKSWKSRNITYQCDACKADCERSYYKCLQCEYHIHLRCLGLPDTVHHPDHHCHPLTLEDSYVEDDDSGEYYCHSCGMRRHGDHPVYRCRECPDYAPPFAAHIECMTSQEYPWINWGSMVSANPAAEATKQIQQQYPTLVEFDEGKRKPQCQRQIKIEDFSNNHHLIFHEDCNKDLRIQCDACNDRNILV